MKWNWQQKDWPSFSYDTTKLLELEQQLLHQSGILFGAYKHLTSEDKEWLKVELISNEALKTSEIEGEYLDRSSLQSSIRRYFGLQVDTIKIKPEENGIAALMIDLYKTYNTALTHEKLYDWHSKLLGHRNDLEYIGCYRGGEELMQVISGRIGEPTIHFEAPPSERVKNEMEIFIEWFNESQNRFRKTVPTLTRAGITHLYFESIHPFEDGNGRIGRVLSEKVLAQGLRQPTLLALSTIINKYKKRYYDALERANKNNEITEWLIYFANTILEALAYTQKAIEFLIEKAKILNRLEGELNSRQKKALLRIFEAGHEGFQGGLSANNYISITKATQPTTTRDLVDLVQKGVLYKIGERKHTRYYLNFTRNC